MLTLQDISKRYKKQTVLSRLSHVFNPGVTVITGPSGAGKSTLLRLCATAEKPSSGDILWHQASVEKRPKPLRQVLGYAPQIIDFPEDVAARDFLVHIGALKGLKYADTVAQAKSVMARLDLGEDMDKRIGAFSGGMRRRLIVAQSLLGRPECLILDEPTAELDAGTARKVYDMIFEHSESAVVLMTTHLADSLTGYEFQTLNIVPSGQS